MVVEVDDRTPAAASVVEQLRLRDHVMVELELGRVSSAPAQVRRVGSSAWPIRFRLGSARKLVNFDVPNERWRDALVSSMGVRLPGGYRIEARIPLATLTPFRSERIDQLRYRIAVYDQSGDGSAPPRLAHLGLGELVLDPPLILPPPVRERIGPRACLALFPHASWGFRGDWACVVPVSVAAISVDDGVPPEGQELAVVRQAEAPVIGAIRERLVFLNVHPERGGGVVLIGRSGQLLSALDFGVIGASDPGNSRLSHAEAEKVRLPSGDWGVVLTHAYPNRGLWPSSTCTGQWQVFRSIVAIQNGTWVAVEGTGEREANGAVAAPRPGGAPRLVEVFRALVDDCAGLVQYELELSRDRSTILVRDNVFPSRLPRRYEFRDGWYQHQR
jgi:hypothetical protein